MATVRLLIGLAFIFVAGCAEPTNPSVTDSTGGLALQVQAKANPTKALEIVNQRMSAYNAHDIDQFMNLYAEDIEIFTYPDDSLGKGKAHLRSLFEPMFEEGNVSVKIHGQFTKDSYVVNQETVEYGNTKTEYVSIYEVRDGLIRSVRFVRD